MPKNNDERMPVLGGESAPKGKLSKEFMIWTDGNEYVNFSTYLHLTL